MYIELEIIIAKSYLNERSCSVENRFLLVSLIAFLCHYTCFVSSMPIFEEFSLNKLFRNTQRRKRIQLGLYEGEGYMYMLLAS